MTRTFFTITALLAGLLCAQARAAAPGKPPVSATVEPATLEPGKQATLTIVTDIPAGFHSQSNTPTEKFYKPFLVTMNETPGVNFSPAVYPPGENHDYGQPLGVLNVYTGRVTVTIPFTAKPDASGGERALEGTVQLQMCDDQLCYAPQKLAFSVPIMITGVPAGATPSAPTPPSVASTTAPLVVADATESPSIRASLSGAKSTWSFGTAMGAALLAGLLFNIMPCVLPVLPLKAAAFYRAAEHHRSRSIMLGAAFSLGIIAVFAVLAVLVLGLRVISWGSLFSNPWFVWSLVILLVVCAVGMFGAIDIRLPTALYTVDPRQDTLGGNFVFGAFTAILATPCTAPLLPPLLVWASAQPTYLGVPAMITVGIGMALPYLILSAFPEAARKFPQTGPWAELFKQMMGFLLLAAAAYFAGGRLIHGPEFWWLVVAVIAIGSFFMIARSVQLTERARPIGIVATLAVIMLGGVLWWTARITGIGSAPIVMGEGATASFTTFDDERFEAARAAGKPVLVKFTANWCGTCQAIEGTVFRNPNVWTALNERGVEVLKVDFSDSQDVPGHDLLLKLNPAGGIPLTAIFPPGGNEPIVLASIYNSAELLAALNQATGQPRASAE